MSIGRMVFFLTVVSSLAFALHYYLWTRLIRDVALPPQIRSIATGTLIVLALSLPASLMLGRVLSPTIGRPFFYVAYSWMGFFFLLLLAVLVSDIARLVMFAARGGAAIDVERRTLLARIFGGFALFAGGSVGITGMVSAFHPILRKVTVPLARLPEKLSGTRIVQLTDVHIGPTLGRPFLQKLVDRVNALEADVIVITGDLVDGSVEALRDQVEPLRELKAKHGVFFVTGNHEYYSGAADWVAHVASLGIRVLRNERVEIGEGDSFFDLAGVDDFRSRGLAEGHGQDIPGALAGRDPTRELVLLAHQPKSIFEASKLGVSLQISGHTHGGQIYPWTYLVYLDQPFVAGLHKLADTWVYVSQGTGFWGPPMRVGAPSEVTEITLVRAA